MTKEDIIRKYPIIFHWCSPTALKKCLICEKNKENEKHWYWIKESKDGVSNTQ